MSNSDRFPEPGKLYSWTEERAVMGSHIRQKANNDRTLNILEAGCGTGWGIDLNGVRYILTGVDLDKNALAVRMKQQKDLEIAIAGDLRTVALEESKYDVIYNSYVLEHVDGAEQVLKNFVRWLKPGGIIILLIPNRDSAWGFLTRMTPFWFHVSYRRYIGREEDAGKPGYAPYPVFYDKIVSRRRIYEFCEKHELAIRAEYSIGHGRRDSTWIYYFLNRLFLQTVHLASFGSLSVKYANLLYIIEKPG